MYFGGDSPRGVDVSEFQPIPELVRDDADVMLLFLSAQGFSYSEPVDDLWYSAHQEGPPLSVVGQASLTKPSYTADEPASALGCSQQFQMCNPHKPKPEGCEPLLGLSAMVLGEGRWSAEQDAAIRWFGRALMSGLQPISNIARLIGTSLLRARYNSMFGVVGPIPDDMWQLEVEHMISASLASLQASPVMIASGAPTENLKQFQSGPDTDMATKMCHNQKILSTRYSSFSALGLAFILFFGSAIIILDLTLEPMITSYHNRRARKDDLPTHHFTGSEHSRLEWRATSVLQLQRLAHAAVGSGTWSRTANETPVTKPFEKLAVLNISKRHCPVYQSQFAESSMEEMSPEFDSVEKCAQVAESLPATPPSPPQSIQAKFEMRRAETGMSGKTLAIKSSQHQEDMPDWRKLDTP